MKEMTLEKMLDVIKWGIIIVIGAIAFYIVCPKYYFWDKNVNYRADKITGKVEYFDGRLYEGKWRNTERQGVRNINQKEQ